MPACLPRPPPLQPAFGSQEHPSPLPGPWPNQAYFPPDLCQSQACQLRPQGLAHLTGLPDSSCLGFQQGARPQVIGRPPSQVRASRI